MAELMCTVRVDGREYDARVALPQSPVCTACKHELCPHCQDWCDVVNERGVPCDCFPRCTFDDAGVVSKWIEEVERRISLACFGGSGALFEV